MNPNNIALPVIDWMKSDIESSEKHRRKKSKIDLSWKEYYNFHYRTLQTANNTNSKLDSETFLLTAWIVRALVFTNKQKKRNLLPIHFICLGCIHIVDTVISYFLEIQFFYIFIQWIAPFEIALASIWAGYHCRNIK